MGGFKGHSRSQSYLDLTFNSPLFFAFLVFLISILYTWPIRWIVSSAPLLQFLILIGQYQGYRVLPDFHLWPLFATLNLVYAICSTSWLLYWVFTVACYGMVILVSTCQFESVAYQVRKGGRGLMKQLHFIDDKIGFFDIPALEIDTEVDGLMVIRGITFSFNTLSFVVHGVEVGIKLSDDMELAISTETVEVKFLRSIEIGDCFANLKGGKFEMTFGKLEGKSEDENGDQVFVEGTPLLKAASRGGDRHSMDPAPSRIRELKMMGKNPDGSVLADSSAIDAWDDMEKVSPDRDKENRRYREVIDFIKRTNSIQEAREYVKSARKSSTDQGSEFSLDDDNAIRAAICSQLHDKGSVPHPPQRSIKVTTLQKLAPSCVRNFLHRLPMLLRLLLNPLAYFHAVKIRSITATASGAWMNNMLQSKVFYSQTFPNHEISTLQTRISAWLSDANFAVELGEITGLAQVPFVSTYDILCQLSFADVMVYRTLPKQTDLKQVIRLGGADAGFTIPSFLLPHHEHFLPPIPTASRKASLSEKIDDADGKPKEIQAEHALEQAEKDEANVKMSVHAKLPVCFDQELLDWVAALVKASKVVELENADSAMDEEVHGIMEFGKALRGGLKEGLKKAVVDGVVNERWIAKMVGKITRRLETAQGEVGYTGDIPVALEVYRTPYLETEGEKILP